MDKIFKNSLFIINIFIIILFIQFGCEKKAAIPTLTATKVFEVKTNSVNAGGEITSDGGAAITDKGVCWSAESNPTIDDSKTSAGTGTGSFMSEISGLNGAATYYVRTYATNSAGTGYGLATSLTTLGALPSVTVQPATQIGFSDATLNGVVNCNYLPTTVFFEYGETTSYGISVCKGNFSEAGDVNVSLKITNLSGAITYHFRIKALNSLGEVCSSDMTFTTDASEIKFNPNLTYGTVTDIEGNIYKTIVIGTQTWMAENLKSTKLNDGTLITLTNSINGWYSCDTAGYCWYNWNKNAYLSYGPLYNRAAVMTEKLCPVGWRVPSYPDMVEFAKHYGETASAGIKLNETGTHHWYPNNLATNELGFTALSGGYNSGAINGGSLFNYIGSRGYWWLSSNDTRCFWLNSGYNLNFGGDNDNELFTQYSTNGGLSVRCIKE